MHLPTAISGRFDDREFPSNKCEGACSNADWKAVKVSAATMDVWTTAAKRGSGSTFAETDVCMDVRANSNARVKKDIRNRGVISFGPFL